MAGDEWCVMLAVDLIMVSIEAGGMEYPKKISLFLTSHARCSILSPH